MAEQVRCPECGADNEEGVRRCRVCAHLLNTEAAEADQSEAGGLATPPPSDGHDYSAAEIDQVAIESVRAERMARRPRLFKKVFKEDDAD